MIVQKSLMNLQTTQTLTNYIVKVLQNIMHPIHILFMRKEKEDGKGRMQHAWQHILDALCFVMTQDQKIRPDAFTEDFTEEKLASVLFSLMLSALLRQDYDPSTVLEMVRRLIY